MACFELSLKSEALGGQTSISVILPIFEGFDREIPEGEKFQTLWLLHGGGGDHTDYVRKTAIEFWAVKHKLAVIMPEVGNSFYTDLPNGGAKYFTYVTEELPALLRKYFPLSEKREDNFICGLSMGGFGAAKCAFNCPEKYAAVGLMSTGPMSPLQLAEILKGRDHHFENIFGDVSLIPHSMNDIWYVLEEAVKNGVDLPKIYDCCGTEDFGYSGFCAFKEKAKEIGLEVTYAEGPGAHTWSFWNEYLPKIIDWLPLRDRNFEENCMRKRFAAN